MARRCDICGKGPLMSRKVSHSKAHTKVQRRPNLQRVRAVVEGIVKRVRVCTSCLKAGKIVKAG